MDSRTSERTTTPLLPSTTDAVKIVIVGGFGVGKTTMVHAVSDIRPLSTEETMTQAGTGIDSIRGIRSKTTTTVAFDFGRISLNDQLVLYLFGAPGQQRFWFLWDRLFAGALGAVVLADARRLADSWYAIDRLEDNATPFIVARNNFEEPGHALGEVRDALDLSEDIPLIDCDARHRESSKEVLIALVKHLYAQSAAREAIP